LETEAYQAEGFIVGKPWLADMETAHADNGDAFACAPQRTMGHFAGTLRRV